MTKRTAVTALAGVVAALVAIDQVLQTIEFRLVQVVDGEIVDPTEVE